MLVNVIFAPATAAPEGSVTLPFSELVACDADHYVDLAVALAGDLPRLADLRSSLRTRMLASPLCDVDRFRCDLAAALNTMWRRWREGQPTASFDLSETVSER